MITCDEVLNDVVIYSIPFTAYLESFIVALNPHSPKNSVLVLDLNQNSMRCFSLTQGCKHSCLLDDEKSKV